MAESKGKKDPSALSFEEATQRLTAIVGKLESGDLPLEESLQLFEEGVLLSRTAQGTLDRAEKRIEELLAITPDGEKTRPFPTTGE